jgi:hypothetical protein
MRIARRNREHTLPKCLEDQQCSDFSLPRKFQLLGVSLELREDCHHRSNYCTWTQRPEADVSRLEADVSKPLGKAPSRAEHSVFQKIRR